LHKILPFNIPNFFLLITLLVDNELSTDRTVHKKTNILTLYHLFSTNRRADSFKGPVFSITGLLNAIIENNPLLAGFLALLVEKMTPLDSPCSTFAIRKKTRYE